jgi:hypothetical protein
VGNPVTFDSLAEAVEDLKEAASQPDAELVDFFITEFRGSDAKILTAVYDRPATPQEISLLVEKKKMQIQKRISRLQSEIEEMQAEISSLGGRPLEGPQ